MEGRTRSASRLGEGFAAALSVLASWRVGRENSTMVVEGSNMEVNGLPRPPSALFLGRGRGYGAARRRCCEGRRQAKCRTPLLEGPRASARPMRSSSCCYYAPTLGG